MHTYLYILFLYLLLITRTCLMCSFMYSAAIWTAEMCNDAKTAVSLLASMRRNGCTPNAISYDGGE